MQASLWMWMLGGDMAQWYYSKNGSQLGPVEQGELLAKVSSGEVSQSDLCWRDGMSDWVPVSKAEELAVQSSPSPPVVPVSSEVMNSPYTPPMAAASTPAAFGGPNIPNYLWQSIVVTIFCCWPFGIPAIVYAAKVDGLKARGDIAGATAASASAKTWCFVAGGIGIGIGLIWFLFVAIAIVSGHH
ncbi:MAG: CD225/dispanin family protein [Luteolibacter sp.]